MISGNGQNRKELNFWVMPNAGFSTRRVLDPYIQEFEKRHPGVSVRLTIHPWSLGWNRIMDMVKGRYSGPKPDVLQVGTTWVATLAYLGVLENIPDTSVLPEDDRQSAYIWDPGAQSNMGQDLFCVPWFIDVRILYYRRDIFEKFNMNPNLLQDWKGFFKACLEIKGYLSKGGPVPEIIAPLGIPGQKAGVLMHDLAPWIWAAGGDFCSDDLSAGTMDDPASIAGCEFYFDLINQGFMPIPSPSSEQKGLAQGFFNGHFAMQFSGAWPIDTFLNPDHPICHPKVAEGFDVTLVPAGPQGRFTFLGGSNLGVTSTSKNRDLAWEFIRFLSEPDRQLQHARSIGALTARLASMEPLFARYPAMKKVFWDSLGHARRLPRLVELGSVEQIIHKMGNKILNLIKSGEYNHKRLHEEMMSANGGMNSVLSLHRYGTRTPGVAA